MGDGIYVGMSGAAAQARALDAIADNLANVETPGFKATRPAFASFLPAGGDGTRVSAAAVAAGVDRAPGAVTRTGAPLDLLPESDAFLAVRLPDGATGYTRDGRVSVDALGRLQAAGHPLLSSEGEPITVPAGEVPRVEESGRVLAGAVEVARLGLFHLDGPAGRRGPALFTAGPGATTRASEAGVRVGELELGNASAMESAVALIEAHRSFDHAMQAIQTYRKLDERAVEIGRVR
ncbi:flagellar hook basal-body protein [Vulgatibacter sp.]|uniref:flagellar hook basal-body protein n=1 Tax=Vulgatibacter sp. TaxID=1971226 RepID=UPI00356835BC